MEWINLHTSVLDSPEFLGADPVERGTWLCLLRYCAGQENGGVIVDCAGWKDRQWQQLASVMLKEVRPKGGTAPRLWQWREDGSLVVFFYPVDAEAKLNHKRDIARQNGRNGGRPPKKNPLETEFGLRSETDVGSGLVPTQKAKGNGKEMEDTPLPPLQGGESGSGASPEGEEARLIGHAKALRKRWQASPLLSARESRVFRRNRAVLALFTPDDWQTLGRFMGARLPDGTGYFQPEMLEKFLENPGSVLGHARDWQGKNRPKLTVVPLPVNDDPTDPPASPEEMKTLLKTV